MTYFKRELTLSRTVFLFFLFIMIVFDGYEVALSELFLSTAYQILHSYQVSAFVFFFLFLL